MTAAENVRAFLDAWGDYPAEDCIAVKGYGTLRLNASDLRALLDTADRHAALLTDLHRLADDLEAGSRPSSAQRLRAVLDRHADGEQ